MTNNSSYEDKSNGKIQLHVVFISTSRTELDQAIQVGLYFFLAGLHGTKIFLSWPNKTWVRITLARAYFFRTLGHAVQFIINKIIILLKNE